jgi:hypothetical protein
MMAEEGDGEVRPHAKLHEHGRPPHAHARIFHQRINLGWLDDGVGDG